MTGQSAARSFKKFTKNYETTVIRVVDLQNRAIGLGQKSSHKSSQKPSHIWRDQKIVSPTTCMARLVWLDRAKKIILQIQF